MDSTPGGREIKNDTHTERESKRKKQREREWERKKEWVREWMRKTTEDEKMKATRIWVNKSWLLTEQPTSHCIIIYE